jgi:GNAT superfamily N-acetyltransferase
VRAAPGLRRAGSSDVTALAGIFVAAWRHGYPGIVPDGVIAAVDVSAAIEIIGAPDAQPEATTVIADVGGAVAGYIQYGPDAEAADAETGYVAALYVHPDHEGHGLGRLLLDHAIRELGGAGRHRIRLWVFAGNSRARSLYLSAGFRPDGAELTDPRWQTPQVRMLRDGHA